MTSLLTCRVGVYTAPRHLQCSACETPFQQILISWIFPRFASVFLPRITKLRMHATFIKKNFTEVHNTNKICLYQTLKST